MIRGEQARLFFAVWPSPEIQRALGQWGEVLQRNCGGRAVPARNIHLTLVFLGDVARGRTETLETLAATVAGAPFGLTVDHVAFWRHNHIAWAGVLECPAALTRLVGQLEQLLSEAGFQIDRRPYVPHITLVRNARRAPAQRSSRPIQWPVERFALMESVPRDRGRAYEVIREWPLAG